jgi:AcrR family transcriptional regulator
MTARTNPLDDPLSARAHATRERLLESGMEAFAESGYSSRLSDIVERAGLTTGAFYRYFDGKAALYASLFERYAHALESTLKDAAGLEDAFVRWLTVSREYRGVVTAGAELVGQDEHVRKSKHELRQASSELLVEAARPVFTLDRVAALLLADVLDQYALADARRWIAERVPALVGRQLMRLTMKGLYGT